MDAGPLGPLGTLWPGSLLPSWWPGQACPEPDTDFIVLGYAEFAGAPTRPRCDAVCWSVAGAEDVEDAIGRLSEARRGPGSHMPVMIVGAPSLDAGAARRLEDAGAVVFRDGFPGTEANPEQDSPARRVAAAFRALREAALMLPPRRTWTENRQGGMADERTPGAGPVPDSGRTEGGRPPADSGRAYADLFEKCENERLAFLRRSP